MHAALDAAARRAFPARVLLDCDDASLRGSVDEAVTGVRQLRVRAIATAVRRLPTPAGPAKSSDGGSVSCATARDSSETSRRCPTTDRKVTKSVYRAPHLPNRRPQNPRFFFSFSGSASGAGAGGADEAVAAAV